MTAIERSRVWAWHNAALLLFSTASLLALVIVIFNIGDAFRRQQYERTVFSGMLFAHMKPWHATC